MRFAKTWALVLLILTFAVAAAAGIAPVRVLTIDGGIDPPMASYIHNGISDAEDVGAQAVLILMDTPGGLMTSMEDIIKSFFAARIPIIVYVYPNGATAASAGTFITMAADIAAMSPVSNIGSASPVSINPSGGSSQIEPTMKRKVENFAVEYARSIAERRGRNPYFWFGMGFIFGIFGLIAIFFIPSPKKAENEGSSTQSEPKPYIDGPIDRFWYYLDQSRQQKGPMSHNALTLAWKTGEITTSTLVWYEDLANWKELQELIKFKM